MFRKRDMEEIANEEEAQTPAPVESAFHPAPAEEEVRAYWFSGRPKHIAKKLMEDHQTTDALTGATIYYIPEFNEEGQELPAPKDLTITR